MLRNTFHRIALIALAAAFVSCSHGASGVAVTVTPGTASVSTNESQTFSASVSGTPDGSVTWAVQETDGGTVNASGVYTAPSNAGTYHLIASSNADPGAVNRATITVVPFSTVQVSPKTAVVQTGLTTNFSATVGGTSDNTVVWSVAEGVQGGSVGSNGVYTAPSTPGTYHVIARSHADSTKQDVATVTVSAPGVVLTPPTALVVLGSTQQFSGQVVGSGSGGGINWTVQEGAAGGSIDSSGNYTPPATPGTYHVVATSAADGTKTAVGIATVVPTGQWINVTPPGVSLDPNFLVVGGQQFNYGAQEVVVDPKNPGTALVNITYQGVWRTRDFGATWTRLGDGTGPMDNGRAALQIAPDGSYIIANLLYPTNGFSNGAWKSEAIGVNNSTTDLGENWRRINVGAPSGDDIGIFRIDPANGNHIVGQPHTVSGSFYESFDAGESWTAQPMPANAGIAKLSLIDTNTVLATYDFGSGINPQLGKRNGSSWNWTSTNAKNEAGQTVAGQTAFHGSQQIFVDTSVVPTALYLGGPQGIQRSTDGGANWTQLSTPQPYSESIVATPNTIYSVAAFASGGSFAPDFQWAPRSAAATGAGWKDGTSAVPASMKNGWLGAAVTSNGQHHIIIAGCWDAGVFIYVEP
jgi:hypothetical protein